MATKQEILDLVGHQPLSSPDGKIIYLTIKDYEATEPSMEIKSESVECSLSEDEMISEVEQLLESFPIYRIDGSATGHMEEIQQLQVRNDIAKNALRGAGNTRFKNSLYYKGDNLNVDSPIIVAEHDGKYGIFKHPNFERYGFVLEQ